MADRRLIFSAPLQEAYQSDDCRTIHHLMEAEGTIAKYSSREMRAPPK